MGGCHGGCLERERKKEKGGRVGWQGLGSEVVKENKRRLEKRTQRNSVN